MKKKAQNTLFIIPDHAYARAKYDYIISKIAEGHKLNILTSKEVKKQWRFVFGLRKLKIPKELIHVLLSFVFRIVYRPKVIGFFDEDIAGPGVKQLICAGVPWPTGQQVDDAHGLIERVATSVPQFCIFFKYSAIGDYSFIAENFNIISLFLQVIKFHGGYAKGKVAFPDAV